MLEVVDDDVDGHHNDGSNHGEEEIKERGDKSIDNAIEDVCRRERFEFRERWFVLAL